MALSLLGGASSAAPKQQKVDGSIRMMAPYAGSTFATCYSGLHRRIMILSSENQQINGVVGYSFDLEPATNKKPFVLEVTGGQGDVDLDITFYTEFGTPEQATDPAYAPANYSYETRGAGGESGMVPDGMKKAIVCMHTGMNATFTYTAGKGVKLPK
ncbi:MAG: hypothetical protein ABR613_07310 [Actinomycetota bacterium]